MCEALNLILSTTYKQINKCPTTTKKNIFKKRVKEKVEQNNKSQGKQKKMMGFKAVASNARGKTRGKWISCKPEVGKQRQNDSS